MKRIELKGKLRVGDTLIVKNYRPDEYEEDDHWNPDTDDWTDDPTDLTTLGGGRYNQYLVVVGHKKIYVGGV